MDFGGASVSGPRPYNEDAYLTIDLSPYARALGGVTGFLIVSDGMGGHQSGDIASRVAVETAKSYVEDLIMMARESHLDLDAAQALREIASEANEAVLNKAASLGGSSMGATFIAAFVSRGKAWIGHVGDSRAYLLGPGGGRQLTVDHSQVGRMIAEGVLTEEQAQSHPNRNVIERALGFSGAEAEITEVELSLGDALVLNSDGMSTVLTGADMRLIAAAAPSAKQAAERLCAEAVTAGTDDNTTAVLWSEDWALFKASAPVTSKGRRAASAQRRQAMRHMSASRTSYAVLGLVAFVAVVLVIAAISGGPKGGGATPAQVAKARDTTRTADDTRAPGAASRPSTEQAGSANTPSGQVGNGVNLRISPAEDKTNGNLFAKTTKTVNVKVVSEKDGWALIETTGLAYQINQLKPHGVYVDPGVWPATVYVMARFVKPLQ